MRKEFNYDAYVIKALTYNYDECKLMQLLLELKTCGYCIYRFLAEPNGSDRCVYDRMVGSNGRILK